MNRDIFLKNLAQIALSLSLATNAPRLPHPLGSVRDPSLSAVTTVSSFGALLHGRHEAEGHHHKADHDVQHAPVTKLGHEHAVMTK
eukprot:6183216-Pleurochrysis_carterae.AAC.2